MSKTIAKSIADAVKHAIAHPTRKFSTKAMDDTAWKQATERTRQAEAEIADTIRRINADQYDEVIKNLPQAIAKDIDPKKLFDFDKSIAIVTDAMTPIMQSLYESEGKAAATELGKPDLTPLSDANAAKALHESIGGVLRAVDVSASAYPPALGGTGTAVVPSSGQVLIGNGSGTYTPAYILCAGTCQVTNASGSITITGTGVATNTGKWGRHVAALQSFRLPFIEHAEGHKRERLVRCCHDHLKHARRRMAHS